MNDIDEMFGHIPYISEKDTSHIINEKQKMISEIFSAIDELYDKQNLSKKEKQDIIIKKVGDKYIAYLNKRRKEKIKKIIGNKWT